MAVYRLEWPSCRPCPRQSPPAPPQDPEHLTRGDVPPRPPMIRAPVRVIAFPGASMSAPIVPRRAQRWHLGNASPGRVCRASGGYQLLVIRAAISCWPVTSKHQQLAGRSRTCSRRVLAIWSLREGDRGRFTVTLIEAGPGECSIWPRMVAAASHWSLARNGTRVRPTWAVDRRAEPARRPPTPNRLPARPANRNGASPRIPR